MLCQKCGLQPAVVHRDTHVFRQKVEEHLCEICAGASPAAAVPAADPKQMRTLKAALQRMRTKDPVKHYLAQMRNVPRLTPVQETTLLQSIAASEQSACAVFFTIPGIACHTLAVAARLLAGKERFARVVDPRLASSRRTYLASLPALIKATRQNERAAVASWADLGAATSETARNRARACYEEHAARLCGNLPNFHFKLRVYLEYAETMQPAVEDIRRCLRPFRDIPRSTAKENALDDFPDIQRRLQRYAVRYRLPPAEFIARLDDARHHEARAHGVRAMLVEAHLRLVITLARKLVNSQRSFLDLIMEGNMSLMRAIDTFDPSAGEAFTPHARRIVGAALAKAAK